MQRSRGHYKKYKAEFKLYRSFLFYTGVFCFFFCECNIWSAVKYFIGLTGENTQLRILKTTEITFAEIYICLCVLYLYSHAAKDSLSLCVCMHKHVPFIKN